MGCVWSHPDESFYHEFFVGRPEKKEKVKRNAVARESIQLRRSVAKADGKDVEVGVVQKPEAEEVEGHELTYEEQLARADLRIYQQEMNERKIEEIYLAHRAIAKNRDSFF